MDSGGDTNARPTPLPLTGLADCIYDLHWNLHSAVWEFWGTQFSSYVPRYLDFFEAAANTDEGKSIGLNDLANEWRQLSEEYGRMYVGAVTFAEREALRKKYGLRLIALVRTVVERANTILDNSGRDSLKSEMLLRSLATLENRVRHFRFVQLEGGGFRTTEDAILG
jgi:hypothetical protein